MLSANLEKKEDEAKRILIVDYEQDILLLLQIVQFYD